MNSDPKKRSESTIPSELPEIDFGTFGLVSEHSGRPLRYSDTQIFGCAHSDIPSRRRGLRYSDTGFTLIETVVSIALLVILAFSIAELFPRAAGLITRSKDITIASNLAQAELETILSQEYDGLVVGTYEPRHRISGYFDRQTQIKFIDPVTFADAISDLGLKRATTTVFYPSPWGEKKIIISTFIADQ